MKIISKVLLLLLFLTACQGDSEGPVQNVDNQQRLESRPKAEFRLKAPDARTPTGGACSSAEGDKVLVTLGPDLVPEPRCTFISGDQHLEVVNQTDQAHEVTLHIFSATIPPQGRISFETPFKNYLSPGGVHNIGGIGGQLWFHSK